MRCLNCKRLIEEINNAYVCDCLTVPKEILSKKITPEIAQELINNGKTQTLDGFISKRTGKRFKASLVVRDKRIAFEFENNVAGDTAYIRIQSENSGTASVIIKGMMYQSFKISYGHESSRMAECLATITAVNLVKHTKGLNAELDISLNNLDTARYILKERVPRDKHIRKALEHLFVLLSKFTRWSAKYEKRKRFKLKGSPQGNKFPVGVFPQLNPTIAEENDGIWVTLPGGPDIQAQFKASLRGVKAETENRYNLPLTAKPALMAWIQKTTNATI